MCKLWTKTIKETSSRKSAQNLKRSSEWFITKYVFRFIIVLWKGKFSYFLLFIPHHKHLILCLRGWLTGIFQCLYAKELGEEYNWNTSHWLECIVGIPESRRRVCHQENGFIGLISCLWEEAESKGKKSWQGLSERLTDAFSNKPKEDFENSLR